MEPHIWGVWSLSSSVGHEIRGHFNQTWSSFFHVWIWISVFLFIAVLFSTGNVKKNVFTVFIVPIVTIDAICIPSVHFKDTVNSVSEAPSAVWHESGVNSSECLDFLFQFLFQWVSIIEIRT